MLDPQSLSSIEIEAHYTELAEKEDKSKWVELPLETLKKMYVTPEEKKFLETKVIAKQSGRNHPQDPDGTDPNMKLYWIFRENTDETGNKTSVGHSMTARGNVPQNKTAMTAIGDRLTAAGADFNSKGVGRSDVNENSNKGNGNQRRTQKGKGKGKEKKVGVQTFFLQNLDQYPTISRCLLIRPRKIECTDCHITLDQLQVKTADEIERAEFQSKIDSC